jgi:hypothetical protein
MEHRIRAVLAKGDRSILRVAADLVLGGHHDDAMS